jgi:hypothetical protein
LLPPWVESDAGASPDDSGTAEEESPLTEIEESNGDAEDSDEAPRPRIDLTQARRWLGQYAASQDLGNLARAGSSYVKGMGGPVSASQSARAARSTTKRLGGFLSDLALSGPPAALDRLDISPVVGRPVEDVLASVQDFLSPAGSSIDESAARSAISATLSDIYERYNLTTEGLDGLSAMDEEGVRSTLQLFAANYIYERMLNAMYNDLSDADISETQLVKMERDIRAFTREMVKLEWDDVDVLTVDWGGAQGDEAATRIFEQAYAVWEAMQV